MRRVRGGRTGARPDAAVAAGRAQYEPELFPGLIYRMKEPKVVLLIFVSGKVVLTGAPYCVHIIITSLLSLMCRSDEQCRLRERMRRTGLREPGGAAAQAWARAQQGCGTRTGRLESPEDARGN